MKVPLLVNKLRSVAHFWVGSQSLPIEQRKIGKSYVPRHLCRCTYCSTDAVGVERHCVSDCPLWDLLQQHAELSQHSHYGVKFFV